MAGQRQPVDLLIVKGKKNLTKKEIEERKKTEVNASADKIKAPSYLPKNLKKEFDRISAELISIKIMTNLDIEALARFIVSEYQFQKCLKKTLVMSVENEKYLDLLLKQEKLFKMSRQAACDLGLTISSRCKLVIPKNPEEEKKETLEDKLFGGL